MRDHLAQRYFDAAHSILQATVDKDLPALERAVNALAKSLRSGRSAEEADEDAGDR